jgi:hypothetical protein
MIGRLSRCLSAVWLQCTIPLSASREPSGQRLAQAPTPKRGPTQVRHRGCAASSSPVNTTGRDLPARLHLPRGRRRGATPARGRLRPGRRADPITVPESLRLLHDTIIPPPRARPGPPAVLVGLETPPPARRPPSPPALERLCRRNTVITGPMTCLPARLRGLTWAALFLNGTRQVCAGTGDSMADGHL